MNSVKLVRSPQLALAPGDEGYFVYDLASGQLHRVNAAAALVLELADGSRSAAAISAELAPVLGDAAAACDDWIRCAIEEEWLRPLAQAAGAAAAVHPDEFVDAALSLRQDGEVLAAFVCQDYATALQADSASNWCSLGELAHIVGRRERAREAYEMYLDLQPGDAEVELIVRALRDEPAPARAPDACIEQLYSRFAGFYEKNMLGDLDYQAPMRIEELLRQFVGEVSGLDILELGCGTGLSGQKLRPYARHLVGIDLSGDMVAQARATGLYDALEQAEITAWLAGSSRDHDAIVACDTLIYFGDLHQVIVPAARRLRPGGWLAFTVERGEDAPFRLTDSGRFCHTQEHIRTVAADAGMSVVSLEEGFLRNEYGYPVTGLVVLLQRP